MADTKTAEILKERYERLQTQADAEWKIMQNSSGFEYQVASARNTIAQAAANRTLELYNETLARF